ncbi:LacI family DNA-binding transcriptional regulator [Rhizobium sp. BK376]|uniref:LacI family DNA-binding transcriptional regulator n=1 Tax=Rhizobium sp. BK376 TaxID=2512149 RepID=UPI0010EF0A44|nr:LacI family DNA-binding transcriptional regulator [Rhizobium sp. BK376]TCR85954.1 LacI family transcriptional regulator [Rhizobium sp. BK376]
MATEKRKRLQKNQGEAVRVSDVARLAGCSTATVSRVQNTPDLVSAETRERVQAAIRALSYMPNSAARALRSNRSRMIGIVIPTLNHAIYASLVDAAQQRFASEGYSLLVATFDYDLDREKEQTAVLIERGAEGLVLVGECHHPEFYPMLAAADIPYINTYVFRPDGAHPCVGIDNRQASFDIAEFLYGLGHRTFGVICALMEGNDRAATRVAGVREALARHGIELDPSAIIERPYSIPSGREALRVLQALIPRPTAIICGNDILAFGALIECHEMGLAVPNDISIVGFDNLDFTAHISPPLTTMDVPAKEMGDGAARFLLDTLKGRTTMRKIRLEPQLIARRTTAPVPGLIFPVDLRKAVD